ncbi:23S rRNA (uracil(1939)-C(5))-methyltransferase RlmD [Aliiglaciecola sp. 3_MG-2023]|uniref:23S rRNA (uracil(1939)-C(5))-methyltransferase RlmD n=1 Tax=Aliiglaciecola sp. 3_MG-2023 TaxID=3062644 RepID=UPI0026E4486F|nr:23S rRNA (uracil(1939)-C(5))-methyltransferase RlmD [Aliiglaciecola sp. 3_MG-2023]MDO6692842.1 23S rRNA (uracil(1939)-C(5))-methyltransferase RlmD [Aliiglaciecola sp. 3_MG-2023]
MVNFYSPKKNKKKAASNSQLIGQKVTVTIAQLDHLAQGISGDHDPLIFVEGVLPGEVVEVEITEDRGKVCHGRLVNIVEASEYRQTPFCQHVDICGGCQTQHCQTDAMLQFKQSAIQNLILHTALDSNQSAAQPKRGLSKASRGGKNKKSRKFSDKQGELNWQTALHSAPIGYRRKTRLSVDARNPDALKLGFRSKGSNKIFNLQQCPVLNQALECLIEPLQLMFAQLQTPLNIGHVSLLNGDNGVQVCIRTIHTLSQQDRQLCREFAEQYNVQLLIEDKHNTQDFATQPDKQLTYEINENLSLQVHNDDFVQVNSQVNQQMVEQAIGWLALGKNDLVLDLFCGIGNFSLPIAEQCKTLIGVEGVPKMVQRAQHNATINELTNCHFIHADLNSTKLSAHGQMKSCNKVLLDPAREGALAVVKQLADLQPSHILYVSCNPATFARDAAHLIEKNYRLDKLSVMDMFPQTAHTELMALFVPLNKRK